MSELKKIEVKNKKASCPNCKSTDLEVVIQTFINNTEHHRVECQKCGSFVHYQGKDKKPKNKIVTMKSAGEIKRMIRNKEIELLNCSDDGEMYVLGTKGNPQHCMHVWLSDFGKEYLVVPHENSIALEDYNNRRIFFK